MTQTFSDVLLHIVFSTKNRQPFIHSGIENRLHQYIVAVCKDLDSPIIQIGGMPDHLHILLSLSRQITIGDLLSKIKSNSSRWVKTIDINSKSFQWQKGYGVFALGASSRETAIRYIANQKNHHKKFTFQTEFISLLKKYNIKYDETDLWD